MDQAALPIREAVAGMADYGREVRNLAVCLPTWALRLQAGASIAGARQPFLNRLQTWEFRTDTDIAMLTNVLLKRYDSSLERRVLKELYY